LQGWFHQKAKAVLLPWLASLAEGRGLSFKRTYGHCSQKAIFIVKG